MNVNSSTMMQQQTQTKKMDGTSTQGNGMGRMMQETLSTMPEDVQKEIQALMQTMEPAERKNAMSQMNQLEISNLTVEDLSKAVLDIFNPTAAAAKSSYPSSFSVYA